MYKFGKQSCECGRQHPDVNVDVICESGAIDRITDALRKLNIKRPFLLADNNTFSVAGKTVTQKLSFSHIPYSVYIYNASPAPDEKAVGSAVMNFDHSCDGIIGIGSGVINDIGKILANTSKLPYIIVATAPSMDGYASSTSSMERNGVKVSLPSKCADIIIGDTDILSASPLHLRLSGLGDMIAKYISIAEWRISSVVNEEYYCESIAQMIRDSLRSCIDNAKLLAEGDKAASGAVFNGLVLSGIATTYAGCSRPASGVEHYISHVWDMRSLGLGSHCSTHGYQCQVGSILASKIYGILKEYSPNREKAIREIEDFCYEDYQNQLCNLIGNGADEMIALEQKEQKYDKEKAIARLDRIISHWGEIVEIIENEVPCEKYLVKLLSDLGSPVTISDLDIDPSNIGQVFEATRDIRDKYVLSRLIFDLGLTKEAILILKN